MVHGESSLFLYGGHGFDYENSKEIKLLGDVWQYNIKKGMWRWIDRIEEAREHSLPAHYGVFFNNYNHPGGRSGHSCIYNNHSMWTFAGVHAGRMRGDVWEFNTSSFQWRFIDVTGDRSTMDEIVLADYGSSNWKFKSYHPGARTGYCMTGYKDSFFIYGGFGFANERVNGWLADPWQFNTTVKKWQYIYTGSQGNMAINSKIEYGNEYPGSRDQLGCWTYNDRLYVFSGRGYGLRENDFWELEIKHWSWKYLGRERDLKAAGDVHPVHKLKYHRNAKPGVREDFAFFQRGMYVYLLGGHGKSGRGMTGFLGDLWIYNHKKSMWKWIDTFGDKKIQKTENFEEKYGTELSKEYHPGARRAMYFASAPKKDLYYVFGGRNRRGIKGDLWVMGFSCFDDPSVDENACSGHGECVRENTCQCESGYGKYDCSEIKNDEL